MQLGLGLSLPSIATKGVSLPRRIAAILRKFGSDAHLYMPGPGVPVLGPELVVNGGFDTGISGWSAGNGSGIQWSSGALRVTRLVVGYTWPNSRQTLTGLLPGRAYAISSKVSNPSGLDAYQSISGKSSAEARSTLVSTTLNSQFVADSTTHSVDVGLYGATGAVGQYVEFETVSVREILGYTNKIDGFTTGNYLESTGNTNASVDGAVGLVLDAAGSVGADVLGGAGGFASSADWSSVGAGWSIGGGVASFPSASGSNSRIDKNFTVTSGKSYLVTYDVVRTAGSCVAYLGDASGVQRSASGSYSEVIVASGTTSTMFSLAGFVGEIRNFVIREVTGIHATQATTANKPTLRRGIVNLLTYSNDFSNAAWTKVNGIAATGDVISTDGAITSSHISRTYATTAGSKYTVAITIRGDAAATWALQWSTSTYSLNAALPISITTTPQTFVYTFTANGNDRIGLGGISSGAYPTPIGREFTAVMGLFEGTVTAQQILDAGGIPLTTTAPASSSAGKYSWQFDGVDDRLVLGSVPFQMADDHCVVVAGNTAASGARVLFSEFDSAGSSFIQCYASGNSLIAEWRDSAASTSTVAITNAIGSEFVFTQQKQANALRARLNSGAFITNNPTLGAFTLNTASIGSNRFGNYHNGKIHAVIVIKGTVSDADLKTLEKWLGSLAGVQIP